MKEGEGYMCKYDCNTLGAGMKMPQGSPLLCIISIC